MVEAPVILNVRFRVAECAVEGFQQGGNNFIAAEYRFGYGFSRVMSVGAGKSFKRLLQVHVEVRLTSTPRDARRRKMRGERKPPASRTSG